MALGRRRRLISAYTILGVGLAGAILLSISVGAHPIPLRRVLDIVLGFGSSPADRDSFVLLAVRLPRTLAAVLIGAGLAVSGVLMQGLFRNPLADPGILGVSSGAALAAAAVIVLGDRWSSGGVAFGALPVAAFCGAVAATLALTVVGRRAGRTDTGAILLAGLAFAALANAALGLLVYLADDRQLRDLSFWTLGSFGGVGWSRLMIAAPPLLAPVIVAPRLGRAFDALAFGEAEAHHMGIRVERTKWVAILATATGVGAAVAAVGIIGFIGMVVPHVMRLALGPSHRALLPASALAGALLALGADIAARILVAPAELPIGILTALVGAPVFLHLVMRRRAGSS